MTALQLLFVIFAIGTCAGAVAVVVSQNVVRMAFWLIVSLGSTAGLFFLLHADFVAATQLLVYVGGTLVLLIFGVMLTASGPYLKIPTSSAELVLAGAIGLAFLGMLFFAVNGVDWDNLTEAEPIVGYNRSAEGNTARPIGLGLLGLRPDKDMRPEADRLSTGYLLPFEIISVHLLVVLVAAAYLARRKRRVDEES